MAAAESSAIPTSSDAASSVSNRIDPITAARGHGESQDADPCVDDEGSEADDAFGGTVARTELHGLFDDLVLPAGKSKEAGLITVDELERRYIERVLELTSGNKSRAAQILGFDRRTLYRKIERYGRSQ